MGPLRGAVLILFGLVAMGLGWTLHSERAWWAYGLGATAIALGFWHILRNRR